MGFSFDDLARLTLGGEGLNRETRNDNERIGLPYDFPAVKAVKNKVNNFGLPDNFPDVVKNRKQL